MTISEPLRGMPAADCQWCGSTLDSSYYSQDRQDYRYCRACFRMSVPVTAEAAWAAMRIVRAKGDNAQLWSPLVDMGQRIEEGSVGKDARHVKLPSFSHAELLAMRALLRSGNDTQAAIGVLSTWADLAGTTAP
jgi:hypothetical protein